jgi:hypothetical protein
MLAFLAAALPLHSSYAQISMHDPHTQEANQTHRPIGSNTIRQAASLQSIERGKDEATTTASRDSLHELRSNERDPLLLSHQAALQWGIVPAVDPYGFPLNAADFDWREYAISGLHKDGLNGIQLLGFDIGTHKWRPTQAGSNQAEQGQWSVVKDGVSTTAWTTNAQNQHVAIYGKGIYAMAPGKVIGCWRNAPENPRPFSSAMGDCSTTDCNPLKPDRSNARACLDSPWLDSNVCNGTIPGGGNHLWIEQDDGVIALYAHMIPGSISTDICPHKKQYMSSAYKVKGNPDIAPEARATNGALIAKGQRLGSVGNSGSSSGPHLHVHLERDGIAMGIPFEKGLWTYWTWANGGTDDRADQEWAKIAGDVLPRKNNTTTMVWPARLGGGVLNYRNIPAWIYQSLFDHLGDSGFWPGLVTCDNDNGTVTYDLIDWHTAPAAANWYGLHGLSDAELAEEIDLAEAIGFNVTSLYTCNSSAVQNSVVIFKKS